MLTGLGRQAEQVCPQGRPGRLVGHVGDDLVGSGVEHLNDLGANQLLGRDMEPVGVTLNGLKQPGSGVAEFSQQRWWLRWGCRRERGSAAASRSAYGVRRFRVE